MDAGYMITLQGEQSLSQPVDVCWRQFKSLEFLVKCLPDLQAVTSVESDRATATIRPGFSFARSDMQLTVERLGESADHAAEYRFTTKGVGASSVVDATFHLIPDATTCIMRWSARVQQLGGLLKAIPSGLIQGGAERVIKDMLQNIDRKLAAAT